MRRVTACLALLLSWPSLALAQPTAPAPANASSRHPEEGRPFIRGYRPQEVAGDGQNWAIAQDARGVIYVGSSAGILEYDGAAWRLIETPTLDTVRSLDIDASGRIYAGSVSDFGYLAPDPAGTLKWVSLLNRVPPDARTFGDVWRTFVTPGGVLFQSEQAIFRFANDQISVVRPPSRVNRASLLDGQLYATLPESGLSVLDGDHFKPLPGTQALAREPFPVVLRYDQGRLLIGTRTNGLFLYDGAALTPFPTGADARLKANTLYRGLALPDGTFAMGTTNAGMVLIDRQGRQLAAIDQASGLPSNPVYYMMRDREGALWLAGGRGLARVEIQSPASFFDQADGFSAAVDIRRHDGRLYLATPLGVSYLRAATPEDGRRLVQVPGPDNQCWSFESMPDAAGRRPPTLVVGCTAGLYQIDGTTGRPISALDGTRRVSVLLRSKVVPARLWVGLFDGLASYRRENGRWIDEGRVPEIADQVRTLFENPDGSVWAGTNSTGLVLVTFPSTPRPGEARPTASVRRFGVADGIPDGGVGVQPIHGAPAFTRWGPTHDRVIVRYDTVKRTFVRDHAFDGIEADSLQPGFGVVDGPGGTLLADFGKGTAILTRAADGSWSIDRATFARVGSQNGTPPLVEPDRVVWLTPGDTLVRYDLGRAVSRSTAPFTTLVRHVTANGDRVLYAGNTALPAPPRLPSTEDSFRFEFAAPTFVDEAATAYQTRLDGLDRDWSPWTKEARRDVTNLGFGGYRFHVRARNVLGQVSNEDTFAFTILPPWYRTWWAYLGYAALFGLAVFGVERLQRRRVLGKERARAQFEEARLRAEAAEALATSEREGKKQVELLSDMGRGITASLDFDTIFGTLYEGVNQLADADVFGVGLYHADRHEIEYRLAIERGKRYAPYTRTTTDPDQLPVWCIEHREPVFINNLRAEYGRYVSRYEEPRRRLEDGSLSEEPNSIIYLPLIAKERVLGIITIQSFETGAYTEHHLTVLRSLASYTAIALDNAAAYRQLNEQEHEIRRLLDVAERARAVAVEADAAKSSFLSTVSHELRTPLTSVLGFAKIIKKRLEERIFPLVPTGDRKIAQTIQQVDDNLKVVVSEGERLTKLIDDVLDLAKIEAGKLEWHMEPVTIGDVIDHATAATSSLFEHKGLRLIKDVAPDLPSITGDRDRVIQVVINLISNAVKFTDAGSITCRAVRRGGDLVVSVIDTGVGIAPADQPKVFERFKQVGDTLTDKPKGTGLGLPICREIVEHHGGRVWVESAPGQGSTFSFSLPLPAAAGDADRGDGPVDLAALIRQLRDQVVVTTPRGTDRESRILVVDDEANIRELLMQELTEAGYRVSTAANGREAIAKVRSERPDLVILDVMMPEMNGFDVAAVLKNDPTTMDTPIVILSIVQDRERGFRLGIDRYLTKPIDTDLLFREIGTLIEQKKSHKRVLVVDEDATTVKTLSDVLTARGYTVSEARAADLVTRAMAVQPDIILLNAVASGREDAVRLLRFEKGLENVLFLVYQ
jgi:signal transduction histidine kinase/CheY-like chemotaxis protein/ligand-binding sensor domain-containing protein